MTRLLLLMLIAFQVSSICRANSNYNPAIEVEAYETAPSENYPFNRRDLRFKLGDELEARVAFPDRYDSEASDTYVVWGPAAEQTESFEEGKENRNFNIYNLNSVSLTDDKTEMILTDADDPPHDRATIKIKFRTPFAGNIAISNIENIHLYLGETELHPAAPVTFLPEFRSYGIGINGPLARPIANAIKKAKGVSSPKAQKFLLEVIKEESQLPAKHIKYIKRHATFMSYRSLLYTVIEDKAEISLAWLTVNGPVETRLVFSGLRALGLDPQHPIFSALEMAPLSGESNACVTLLR